MSTDGLLPDPWPADLTRGAERPLPGRRTARLFEESAHRHADRVAVRDGGRLLGYRGLNRGANFLCRELVARDAGPEAIIALALPRSASAIAATIAVTKTGAAYLPVDLDYPPERIRLLLEDAAPGLVVTDSATAARLPLGPDIPVLLMDAPEIAGGLAAAFDDPAPTSPFDQNPAGPGPVGAEARDLAFYLIYTSGSTGRPKGVVIREAAVLNRLTWMRSRFAVGPQDRFLQKTSAGFDVSVWELFLPLICGASIVVAPSGTQLDPERLSRLIRDEQVTFVHFVPSVLRVFLEGGLLKEGAHLRTVICSGEALEAELQRRFYTESATAELFNLYGPTETTANCYWPCVRGDERATVPIGRPLDNMRAYILDGCLEPAATGVTPGRSSSSGGVARGYLGRAGRPPSGSCRSVHRWPDADVPHRRSGPARRPRASWSSSAGSTNQVKIRGFRVEPAEVEAVLARCPGVAQVVVLARDAGALGKILVAYVKPAPSPTDTAPDSRTSGGAAACDEDTVRHYAEQFLPGHMVPTAIRIVPSLPLNAHGKVDRAALPEVRPRARTEGRAPRDELERVLAGFFSEVLDLPEQVLGIDEDFFRLGGHSIAAARLAARARAAFGVDLPVRVLFDHPSLDRLSAWLRANGVSPDEPVVLGDTAHSLRPVPRTDTELSYAQRRLWFLQQLGEGGSTYHERVVLRVQGRLDQEVLRTALGDLAVRHEALRTVYLPHEDGALQHVCPPGPIPLGLADCPESGLAKLIDELSAQPFDLTAEFPLRAWLLDAEGRHVLVLSIHHIATDGWSTGVLLRDLGAAYSARAGGSVPRWRPLPVQYPDFAVWERSQVDDFARHADYWSARLAGAPVETALPRDRTRAVATTQRAGTRPVSVPPDVHAAVTRWAAETGTSVFMVLHAAVVGWLWALGAGDDILVGTPVAGREDRLLDDVVGFFVNTLVLRVDVGGDPTWQQLLARVRETDLDAYQHQALPFEELVRQVNPVRASGRHPLFQVMLTVDEQTDQGPAMAGATTRLDLGGGNTAAKFDLSVAFHNYQGEGGDPPQLRCVLEFDQAVFGQDTADRMAARLESALAGAVRRPDQPVKATRWPTADLVDLFIRQVRLRPEAVAVTGPQGDLTYAELHARAERLSRSLPPSRGDLVGVLLPCSAELVVAEVAILLAGGAYLPLDRRFPAARMAQILTEAGVSTVIASPDLRDHLPPELDRTIVLISESADASTDHGRADTGPAVPNRQEQLAYVMYTSGTTGLPKGVAITHRNVVDLASDHRWADLEQGAMLLHSSPAFDASTLEVWAPLLRGGRIAVGPADLDAQAVRQVVGGRGVTHLWVTAGLFAVLAEQDPGCFAGARQVWTGGDVVPTAAVYSVLRACPGLTVVNGYGPTETTTFATSFPFPHDPRALDEAGSGPNRSVIGRPLDDMRVYVLDSALARVGPTATGEIFVGGAGLARGYLGRAGATAERFLPDPFIGGGARMYRTGDLGRWSAEGQLEFLGRADDQVKIRGFRVEPAEVEAVLARCPGVAQVVVLARDAGALGKILVAYVKPAPSPTDAAPDSRTSGGAAACDEDTVRHYAEQFLPGYMVPTAIRIVPSLPLGTQGKVDRSALPEVSLAPSGRVGSTATASTTAAATNGAARPLRPGEELLLGIFREVLGLPTVGIDDNFFRSGGHSLAAVRLTSRVQSVLGARLPVRAVFDHPTVAGLAASPWFDQADRAAAEPVEAVIRQDHMPLSSAQRRLWFLYQLEGGDAAYNVQLRCELRGPLDEAALRAALGDVVARHEALRTTYGERRGVPHQIVHGADAAHPQLHRIECPAARLHEQAMELREYVFDLTAEFPLRAWLLAEREQHVLVLLMHHIATDGWSTQVLLRDLGAAYSARVGGAAPTWETLTLQYADFAAWEQRWLAGVRETPLAHYWRERLAGVPTQITLPRDRPHEVTGARAGGIRPVSVSPELYAAVTRWAADTGTTVFMVLHAAVVGWLWALGAGDDVVLGTPVAGREFSVLDDVMGCFVNTLVLRTDLAGDPTWQQLLARVREADLNDYQHQALPFEELVRQVNPVRASGRHPLFQVMLTVDDRTDQGPAMTGLRTRLSIGGGTPTAKFDLAVAFQIHHDDADGSRPRLQCALEYDQDLFDPDTADRMAAELESILATAPHHPGRPVKSPRNSPYAAAP